jgi:predicted 2-oxoglutarate/Fe(II)-dependent dioxygenase YbiX
LEKWIDRIDGYGYNGRMVHVYPNVFSISDCEEIISFCSPLVEKSRIENDYVNHMVRNSVSCGVQWRDVPLTFHSLLQKHVMNNPYGLSVAPEPYQYTEYTKGHFYDWHTDIIRKRHRQISVSVLLCDPNDFTGGEFSYIDEHGSAVSVSMGRGDIVMFPSWYKHRVGCVKSGKRISLVGWYG